MTTLLVTDPLALPPVPAPAAATHPVRDKVLLWLLALSLAMPGLALVVTWSRTNTLFENRPAVAWPTPFGAGFTAAFERAFADRFGGRDQLIWLHHAAKVGIFGISPVNKVLVGREGWLYYAGDDGREFERRRAPVDGSSAKQAAAVADGIGQRVRYLAERGARYVMVVVPDKQTIYPEHLPAAHQRRTGVSPLDVLLATAPPEIRRHIVDLRPALLAAKHERQLYFRTDSHWNESGAWVGHLETLAAVRRELGLPQPARPAMPPVRPAGRVDGDLVKMMGVGSGLVEPALGLVRAPGWTDCARSASGAPLQWGAPMQALRCPTAALGKVAIYHDSMGIGLLPLLANEFQESLWVSDRKWNLAQLAAAGPAVVVDEVVERNLAAIADTSLPSAPPPPPAETPAPWAPGPPPGLAAQARVAGVCSLDRVDGQALSGSAAPLPRRTVLVEGWAADVDGSSLPALAWLVLESGGASVHVPLELGRPRPDVAAALDQPAMATAGYRVKADLAALAPARYRAWLVWVGASGWSRCDARRTLLVDGAAR